MKALLGLPFVLIGIALYFLPAIIAYMRKYKNRMSVLVIDLFLGWTLVGWVVALALSLADDVEENEKQDEMMKNVLKIGGMLNLFTKIHLNLNMMKMRYNNKILRLLKRCFP